VMGLTLSSRSALMSGIYDNLDVDITIRTTLW
jgi:hypothetical protein